MIEVGSDFSGVGAFDQALRRLGIKYKTIFSCDMDKYARQTYMSNYGEPSYYPKNVYDREIPTQSLDVYMTSPPCQAFSLAGKRKGEGDKRGILFYNSHEFINKNKPRYFIFENVKGLLSDSKGRTFQTWIDMLGGKSVNGNPVIFPREDATPYHIYHKVLNAKHFGIPQNRERVFIIGIRDDKDNNFNWPKKQPLKKRLKDVLENKVDDKYYLSEKMLQGLISHKKRHDDKGTGFSWKPRDTNKVASCIRANAALAPTDNTIKVGYINQDTQASAVFSENGTSPTLSAGTHGYAQGYVSIGAIRGRNPENPLSREVGLPTEQRLELNMNGTSNALTTVQKDNVVVYGNLKGGKWDKTHEQSGRVYDPQGIGATIHTMGGGNQEPKVVQDYRIRKLTPLECFRLMDFPDDFEMPCSNSQMYKQAGNSICVGVLSEIIGKLKL